MSKFSCGCSGATARAARCVTSHLRNRFAVIGWSFSSASLAARAAAVAAPWTGLWVHPGFTRELAVATVGLTDVDPAVATAATGWTQAATAAACKTTVGQSHAKPALPHGLEPTAAQTEPAVTLHATRAEPAAAQAEPAATRAGPAAARAGPATAQAGPAAAAKYGTRATTELEKFTSLRVRHMKLKNYA